MVMHILHGVMGHLRVGHTLGLIRFYWPRMANDIEANLKKPAVTVSIAWCQQRELPL